MSVTGKKPPSERSLLGVVDEQARETVQRAKQDVAPIVSRETPRRSGATSAALQPRARRTSTGAALTVAPPRGRRHPGGTATVADVVRWLNRGTGLHRDTPGPKRRIRSSRRPPRPMVLPGGRRVWTTAGQKPNPFMGRIKAVASLRVDRAFRAGATSAARAVGRKVGG